MKIIFLNLKNVPAVPIELKVYGFFRSKVFHISVTPESVLQNNSFKTAIIGINEHEIYSKTIILKEIKPTPTIPKIKLNRTEIKIKQPSFTQTDFL